MGDFMSFFCDTKGRARENRPPEGVEKSMLIFSEPEILEASAGKGLWISEGRQNG